jgi:hypothetical protein
MREKQRRDGEEDMGRRLERREEQRSRGRRSREFFVREKAFREREIRLVASLVVFIPLNKIWKVNHQRFSQEKKVTLLSRPRELPLEFEGGRRNYSWKQKDYIKYVSSSFLVYVMSCFRLSHHCKNLDSLACIFWLGHWNQSRKYVI